MQIRDATLDDAGEICTVLRRSITELCREDHLGENKLLDEWLANKTPENVAVWIVQPKATLLVGLDDELNIATVGSITDTGKVLLNYVLPEKRFCGFSKALLQKLEQSAADRGVMVTRLASTATAHRFYLRAGYVDLAGAEFDPSQLRMSKILPSLKTQFRQGHDRGHVKG